MQGHALFTRHAGGQNPCPFVNYTAGFNDVFAAAYGLQASLASLSVCNLHRSSRKLPGSFLTSFGTVQIVASAFVVSAEFGSIILELLQAESINSARAMLQHAVMTSLSAQLAG